MALDGKYPQKYQVNVGVPEGSILGPTLFLLYISDLIDDLICNIGIYTDDTTLYCKCDQASDLNRPLNLNQIYEALSTGAGSGLFISVLEKLNLFRLTSLIIPVLLM